MDTNEITVNEEVIEATEKITSLNLEKSFKITVGIGLTVLTGIIAYKYIVKPMAAAIKTKKNQRKIGTNADSFESDEFNEELDENE